jgi:hypothetical protein
VPQLFFRWHLIPDFDGSFQGKELMPLHYTREGYTFRADANGLTIEPGPKPITLTRHELEQLGLQVRDDFRIPLGAGADKGDLIDRILAALHEAINRCRGPEEAWMAQDLKRAMILDRWAGRRSRSAHPGSRRCLRLTRLGVPPEFSICLIGRHLKAF